MCMNHAMNYFYERQQLHCIFTALITGDETLIALGFAKLANVVISHNSFKNNVFKGLIARSDHQFFSSYRFSLSYTGTFRV
jgi:hypothetical protein